MDERIDRWMNCKFHQCEPWQSEDRVLFEKVARLEEVRLAPRLAQAVGIRRIVRRRMRRRTGRARVFDVAGRADKRVHYRGAGL